MTHPLLAFMMTPMAAPETRRLRRLRYQWMALCWSLSAAVLANPLLTGLFGPKAALIPLLLGLAAAGHGLLYFSVKNRADAAHMRDAEP